MSSRRVNDADGAAAASLAAESAGRSPRESQQLAAGDRRTNELEWPPQMSAIGLIDGVYRRGSTGQLFVTKSHVWIRVRDEGRPVPHHGSGP